MFLSFSRWPSWSAGGPGGGRANSTTCLPGGHGCLAPEAKHTRAASRHSLADTVGTHCHRSAEPTVTGASTQQVRVLPVPSTIIFCNTTRITQVFNVAFSSACLSSCSSNLHSYARPMPRSMSPPGGRYSQRSRVGPHVYRHHPKY